MRRSEERRQWEHTDEEESLHGFSMTNSVDMPPSLRDSLDALYAVVATLTSGIDTAIAQANDLALRSAAACNAMEAERDAYKRAKEENDERFMTERDEARRYLKEAGDEMLARWNAINKSLAENRALAAERDRLKAALEAIAADTDADGFEVRQAARRALESVAPPTPPVGTPPVCDEFTRCSRACYDAGQHLPKFDFTPPAPAVQGERRTTAEWVGMLTASLPRAVQGEPPRCAEWCGTRWDSHDDHEDDAHFPSDTTGAARCYCTQECLAARKPLHPREGEQGRCGTCGGDGFVSVPEPNALMGMDTRPCPACRGTRPPQGTPEGPAR